MEIMWITNAANILAIMVSIPTILYFLFMLISFLRLKIYSIFWKIKNKRRKRKIDSLRKAFNFYVNSISTFLYSGNQDIKNLSEKQNKKFDKRIERYKSLNELQQLIINDINLFHPIKIWKKTTEIIRKTGKIKIEIERSEPFYKEKRKHIKKQEKEEKEEEKKEKEWRFLFLWKTFYFKNIKSFSSIIFKELTILHFLVINMREKSWISMLSIPIIDGQKISFYYFGDKTKNESIVLIWLNLSNMKWELNSKKTIKQDYTDLIEFLNLCSKNKEWFIVPKVYMCINEKYIKEPPKKIISKSLFNQEFLIFKNIKDTPNDITKTDHYDDEDEVVGIMRTINFYYSKLESPCPYLLFGDTIKLRKLDINKLKKEKQNWSSKLDK